MPGQGLLVEHYEAGIKEGASSTETIDLERSVSTRQIMVDDADRVDAYWQMLGYSWTESGVLKRHLPAVHPEMPWLVCRSVRCERLGFKSVVSTPYGDYARYHKCKLTGTYETVPYILLADDEISIGEGDDAISSEFHRYNVVEGGADGDMLSLPINGAFAFSEGPNKGRSFPGNPGIITPYEQVRIKFLQISEDYLNETAILNTLGRVNSKDFGYPEYSRLFYPAGRLLLLSAEWHRIFMPFEGKPGWDVTYTFRWVGGGHNRLVDFKASPPRKYQVTTKGPGGEAGTFYADGSIPDGVTIHGEADFYDLWDSPEG